MTIFSPNKQDFDAYGTKIAMNDNWLILADNTYDPPYFLVQFPPYNNTELALQCYIQNASMASAYIYTVAFGKSKSQNQMQFYFAGEFINKGKELFVGLVVLNYSNAVSSINSSMSALCDTGFTFYLKLLNTYQHQEYYILAAEPTNNYTYGFSNEFIFIFDSRTTSSIDIWRGSLTWPDATFIPHAVDINENFGVIAGFIYNGQLSRVKYSPIVYLFTFDTTNNHPIIVDQYKPVATPASWQDLLTNDDANVYSAKYDMSVSINEYGDVLVGMQFMNKVFLFSVNTSQPTNLSYVSRNTGGRAIGNGKDLAWLDYSMAAIIVNVYTLDYVWSSSQIYFFYIEDGYYNSNSTPLSAFPNNHQKLPQSLDPVFINIVSSPSSLALLDKQGHILIFLPTLPGFYITIKDTGEIPLTSTPQLCLPGTYKNQSGVHDCSLCPQGTKNPGNLSTYCVPCLPDSFCPLAAVYDTPKSLLKNSIQITPYPQSPETALFSEILLKNMFYIGSGRCISVSPLFWTLIVGAVAFVIIIIMEIVKYFIKGPRGVMFRHFMKFIGRHIDLIGEGEIWIGGFVSLSLIVLISFACSFSTNFIKQYPIETSSDSYFACDISLRNAKFDSRIQSLTIPMTGADHEIFNLLSNQEFLLNVDFINTLIACDAVSIEALFSTTWSTIRWLNCNNLNSTLHLSIPLPFQHSTVRVTLSDVKTVGALRIGLQGEGHDNESYTLKELNFYQVFYKNEFTLARNLPVTLSLTKVINETQSIHESEPKFSGIFAPTFTIDSNTLFFTEDQFVLSAITMTTLSLTISETPYYIKNLQQPIAKPSEIVFQNLLFIIVCLEIFRLVFLSYKLILRPFYYYIMKKKWVHEKLHIHHKCGSTCHAPKKSIAVVRDEQADSVSHF